MTTIGDALQELLGLPGARYSCVADPTTGQVLGESGENPTAVPTVFLAWGSGAARFLAETDADELDDLIVTSRRSYHLVRQVGTAASGRLLVYLCLDRARGNLAAARRELGSARLQDRLTAGAHPGARRALPPASPVPPATKRAAAAPRPSASSPSVVSPVPGAHPVPIVPRQRAMSGLPRRSVASPPPRSAPRSTAPPTVPPGLPGSGLSWTNDAGALRRLLGALRRMT